MLLLRRGPKAFETSGKGALVVGAREGVALAPRPGIVWSSMASIDPGMVRTVANKLIELEAKRKLQHKAKCQ